MISYLGREKEESLKLGESRTWKEWQEKRKRGESALRDSHGVVDSGDGDIQWDIITLTETWLTWEI